MSYNGDVAPINDVLDDIKNKESVVLYRDIGGVGDAIMITGAITGLRRELGDSIKIVVATTPQCAPVFYNNPRVDWIIDSTKYDFIHGDQAVDYGSGQSIVRNLFENTGSLFIPLSHPCPSAFYESNNEPVRKKRRTVIAKSRQELFAETCGVKFKHGDCEIYLTPDEVRFSRKLVKHKRYIVLHVQSNSKSRNLPKYHIDNLIRLLSKKLGDTGLVLISHNWDYKHEERGNVTRIINSPLRSVFGVIANSDMLVGVDSMGCHAAGALRVPVFGIFGTVDPKMRLGAYPNATWYKGYTKCKWMPCWYHPCVFNYCMKCINIDDLSDKIIHWYNIQKEFGGVL